MDHIADYLQFISSTQLFWFLLNTSYDHGCHCHWPVASVCDSQEQESEEGHEDEEESCHKGFASFSRRQRQRFQRRQQKVKEESYYLQVRWERTREVNRCTQLVRAAEWRVRSCFGFLPNLALSIHKNAREVMGDTSPGCYFLKAMNTAFHDLT